MQDQITIGVEPIIEPALFDAVQSALKARNPRVTAPRVVTGPILLTGLATCASCGGGMTLRTGKSGRYRYYTCATCAQRGKSACKGRSIPMEKLDQLVSEHLAKQLLTPERTEKLLSGLMYRQASRNADHAKRLTALKVNLSDAETRLARLYNAIETGVADAADPMLKNRLAALRTERDIAQVALDRARAELRPDARITTEKIAAFAEMMRRNVLEGETAFRHAYIRSIVDQVEVDDAEIRIIGRKTVLERLVMAGDQTPGAVLSFVREWRRSQSGANASLEQEQGIFGGSGLEIGA